jgi:general stress protein 26
MHERNGHSNDIDELANLIKGIRTAMLTTRSGEGRLVSRPLATREVSDDGVLYFLTSIDSKKVHELAGDPCVNLAYVDDGRYVSVDGRAEAMRDPSKIDQLWNESVDSLYFPKGRADPDLVVLRVVAQTAEAWTSSGSHIGRAFDFLKAKLTHDPKAMGEQRHYER